MKGSRSLLKDFISILIILSSVATLYSCKKDYSSDYYLKKIINEKSYYPEGPLLYKGVFYYVEYSKHRVMKWDGKRNSTVWEHEGCGPASLVPRGDFLAVACYDSNTIVVINVEGKALSIIDRDALGKKFKGPNDFVSDARGGIYFTASGVFDTSAPKEGAVYYISKENKVEKKASNLRYPNGVAVINKGKTLLVNEHFGPHITSFDIDIEGNLSNRGIFFDLKRNIPQERKRDEYSGPDGIEATEDRIYVAHYGGTQILVTNHRGILEQIIAVPLKYVTNIAISTKDEMLYITAVENSATSPYEGKVFQYTK